MADKITHQKIRAILKRHGVKLGSNYPDRIGRSFFYGGHVGVKKDWRDYDNKGVVEINLAEVQGSRCSPPATKDISLARKQVEKALKKELPNAKIREEVNKFFVSY